MLIMEKRIKWIIFLCLLAFIILMSCGDDDQHKTPLTVKIASLGHGATVTGIVSVSVSASDNVGVTKVEFYIDNILRCSGIVPCTYQWNTAAEVDGLYTVKARAYDEEAHSGEHSITVNVDNIADAIGWIGGAGNGWKTGTAPASGSDYQSFNLPSGVYVDSAGNIYVAEENNHRISKWDKNGNAIGWIGGGSNGWKTGTAPTSGSDYQSFNMPFDVYVDGAGIIYIADLFNHRISKWYGNGNAMGWIGGGSNGWKTSTAPTFGSDYQSFNFPKDLYIDGVGNIYVADSNNHRINKWKD